MSAPKDLQHDMLRVLGQIRKAEREGKSTILYKQDLLEVQAEMVLAHVPEDDDCELENYA